MQPSEFLCENRKTTCDAFLDGRLTVCQPARGPRAAIDALFLAAAVPAVAGKAQRVLEAGAATGVASLALCRRVGDVRATGVELQSTLVELARKNAALNAMEDRLRFIEADVTLPWKQLEAEGLERESFEHVAANPPYYETGTVRERAHGGTATAYSFGSDQLEKWLRFLTTVLAPRGTVTLVNRADALATLLNLLDGRFGALTVFPLFPAEGSTASRVLVQGIKGSRAPLRVLRGLVLHTANGDYTSEANAVLRDAQALELNGS
ncbi:MAG: methyltransferase domain-containing protein [Hyphomicrobiaceae bacterium]|nr:methyltransferase domain-containing protein [Hyphomicrobiaceae bacterium]